VELKVELEGSPEPILRLELLALVGGRIRTVAALAEIVVEAAAAPGWSAA
jgi:hypothetical protein